MAQTVSEVRKTRPNNILMDVGNYILGTPFNLFSPHSIFEVYRMIGYNVTALGYYDVDDVASEPIGTILNNELRNSTYKTICSNWNLEGMPDLDFVKHTAVVDVGGVRVGVLATIGFGKDPVAIPGTFSRISYQDGIKRGVDELVRQGVGIVVALMADVFNFVEAIEIARTVPGIDVILCANDKAGERLQNSPGWGVVGPMPMVVASPSNQSVYIGSAGQFGNYLGVLDVEFDDDGAIVAISGDSYATPEAEFIRSNPSIVDPVAAEVFNYTMQQWGGVSGQLNTPFGKANFSQAYDEKTMRYVETPVSNFFAEGYRYSTKADIGVVNTGSLRAGITGNIPIDITWAVLFQMSPFYEPLDLINITGWKLYDAMNNAFLVANVTTGDADPLVSGRFEGIAGMKVTYNPDADEYRCNPALPDRVVTMEVFNQTSKEWAAVDLNASYSLVVNEYNRWGGDEFYIFATCPSITIDLINTIDGVIDYVRSFPNGVDSPVDGRIKQVNGKVKFWCEPLAPIMPVGRQFTDPESITFAVLTIISLLAVFAAFGFTFYFKLHPVMVAASTVFLMIILVGFILILVSGFLEYVYPSAGLCMARVWLLAVGFIFSYGAMLAKNWRVYQIFRVKNLRRIKPIPTSKLIYRSSFLLIITLAVLVLWSALSPLQPSTLEQSQQDLENRTYRVTCYEKDLWPYPAIFVFFGILTIAGFVLSFLVREAPVEFHESKWIAFITYAVVLFGAVMILLFYLASSDEVVWFSIRQALFIVLVDICLCLLFIPKIIEVMKDPTKQRLDRFSTSNNSRATAASLPSMKSVTDEMPNTTTEGGNVSNSEGGQS